MIIKKFQGATEEEAILAAKEEMGSSAVVMNIRTTKKKGIFKMFQKSIVEVTAALEEKEEAVKAAGAQPAYEYKPEPNPLAAGGALFEKRLDTIESMLEQQIKKEEPTEKKADAMNNPDEDKENLGFLRLVYKQLTDNEVEEAYANQIIGEVEKSLKKEAPLDSVLSAVYQKIILKLGEPSDIKYEEGKKKLYYFIGPTGVGKTTTIAKLASEMKLTKKAKIALMTSDTYRIAAVEQLRTYANILDIPLEVIYTEEDLKEGLERFWDYDVIFVDTAGRSHKNQEQCEELFRLIRGAEGIQGFEKEICLVLSVTTKFKDLENICNTYNELGDYRIIFTKLDETSALGNILNVAILTNGTVSYTTFGQNVPDDINLMDVQHVAKHLLGGVK